MPNLITTNQIAAEALLFLEADLVAANLLYRDKTEDFASHDAYKVGEQVRVKTRPEFETKEFNGTTVNQEVRESYTNFTIEKHLDVTVPYTSRDASLNMEGVNNLIIMPAMMSLAEKIDSYLLSKIHDSRNLHYAPANFGDVGSLAQLRKAANLHRLSPSQRIGLVDSDLEADMLTNANFTSVDVRGNEAQIALREASLGRALGIDWFSSVNIPSLTRDNGADTAVVTASASVDSNGDPDTNQVGNTKIGIGAATMALLTPGCRLAIAGVKRHVVFLSTGSAGAGDSFITLAHQLDEPVPVGAAITVVGTTGQALSNRGVVCNMDAFAFAMPPLDTPNAAHASVLSMDGITIRVTEGYNHDKKVSSLSFDALVGAVAFDARKSVIIAKAT